MRIKTTIATLIAATALVELSACSDDDSGSSADFNKADVSFAQDMIPHHIQATEMATLVESRTQNADVRDLASKIIAAQQPEIETMSGWLKSWDQEVPGDSSDMGDMDDMDHGSTSDMPGMMSDRDMGSLERMSGDRFDTMFLTMMISHHEGAIEMAEDEVSDGKYAPAVTLARKIQKDQAAEITTMEALLQP